MISITLLACAASALAYTELEYQSKFVDFMQKHQKSYQHEEFQQRYNTFKQNVDFIDAHTADPKYRYTVAMNAFGDLTAEEFKAIYNGVRYTHVETAEEDVVVPEELYHFDAPMPKSVDWRTKGCVTPVKNQGQCGSCWSFSTTGSTEAQHMLSGQGKLVGLSEQNLMDCSTSYGNKGCGGGLMDDAFKYIIANKGIDTEASYPYTAMNGPTCEYKEKNRGACIEKYTDVPSKNETALTIAVSKIGPVSVAIDAGESSFQFYSGGVYYSYFCSQTALDHGVLVVGYGVEGTEKFYWVKNSWGGLWGDSGYIKMIRDWDNNCGIATAASYPKAQAKC